MWANKFPGWFEYKIANHIHEHGIKQDLRFQLPEDKSELKRILCNDLFSGYNISLYWACTYMIDGHRDELVSPYLKDSLPLMEAGAHGAPAEMIRQKACINALKCRPMWTYESSEYPLGKSKKKKRSRERCGNCKTLIRDLHWFLRREKQHKTKGLTSDQVEEILTHLCAGMDVRYRRGYSKLESLCTELLAEHGDFLHREIDNKHVYHRFSTQETDVDFSTMCRRVRFCPALKKKKNKKEEL